MDRQNTRAVTTLQRYILHAKQNSGKKPYIAVLPFGEQQWSKVQRAATSRREKRYFENSVYYNVVLGLPKTQRKMMDIM